MAEGQDNSYRGLNYPNLGTMAPGAVRMAISAAGHAEVQRVVTGMQADALLAEPPPQAVREAFRSNSPVGGEFCRGKIVLHKPSQHKVTIIQANYGKKDGEVAHIVVDNKRGTKFVAKQSNLKAL